MQAIASSVGPYRFSTMEWGVASDQALATSAGSASPQNMLTRRRGYKPGFNVPNRFMNTAVDGTENQMVRRESLMNRRGLISVFSDGQHTQAPRSQATNMSATDKSNVMSNVCENRSS